MRASSKACCKLAFSTKLEVSTPNDSNSCFISRIDISLTLASLAGLMASVRRTTHLTIGPSEDMTPAISMPLISASLIMIELLLLRLLYLFSPIYIMKTQPYVLVYSKFLPTQGGVKGRVY